MSVFIIAEAGSSHDNDLQKAYRLIEAAKECRSSAIKFQWTSNSYAMAVRRGLGQAAADMYGKYLQKPVSWLESLKAHADKVGIEFMCTVYLIEDIATIAPLVKRFKISAFECQWKEFKDAHQGYGKQVICSVKAGESVDYWRNYSILHCVSEYPCPLEHAQIRNCRTNSDDRDAEGFGLSDHTANVLTGAAAVAAGARIVEAHIRLHDTDKGNPDYPHSLCAESGRLEIGVNGVVKESNIQTEPPFAEYVRNIRTIERML